MRHSIEYLRNLVTVGESTRGGTSARVARWNK